MDLLYEMDNEIPIGRTLDLNSWIMVILDSWLVELLFSYHSRLLHG